MMHLYDMSIKIFIQMFPFPNNYLFALTLPRRVYNILLGSLSRGN